MKLSPALHHFGRRTTYRTLPPTLSSVTGPNSTERLSKLLSRLSPAIVAKLGVRAAPERHSRSQKLKQCYTRRPDVGPAIDRLTQDLLRGHVEGSPHDRSQRLRF